MANNWMTVDVPSEKHLAQQVTTNRSVRLGTVKANLRCHESAHILHVLHGKCMALQACRSVFRLMHLPPQPSCHPRPMPLGPTQRTTPHLHLS